MAPEQCHLAFITKLRPCLAVRAVDPAHRFEIAARARDELVAFRATVLKMNVHQTSLECHLALSCGEHAPYASVDHKSPLETPVI
jgi:hypothetical protein